MFSYFPHHQEAKGSVKGEGVWLQTESSNSPVPCTVFAFLDSLPADRFVCLLFTSNADPGVLWKKLRCMLRSPEGVYVRDVSNQGREVCETKMEQITDALGDRSGFM